MSKILGFVCFFVAFVLLGCSSFNNSFNSYTVPASVQRNAVTNVAPKTLDADLVDEPDPIAPEDTHRHPVEHNPGACPVSPWPEPGTPPPYPYQQMMAAEGDLDQIERIERKHIDDLRAYISERRKLNRAARLKFEEKCVAAAKR